MCVCSSARLCVCAAAVIPQLIMSYFQLENNAAFMVSAAALLGLGGDDSHGWIIASARPFFQVHLSVPFSSYLGNTFGQILPVFCFVFYFFHQHPHGARDGLIGRRCWGSEVHLRPEKHIYGHIFKVFMPLWTIFDTKCFL